MTKPRDTIADELDPIVEGAHELGRKLGLDPYPVNYWIVDHDEMNELIAYGGFQTRYPHWRWGMKYDRQQKESQFLGGKAFEIVNNDNPAHAFLQKSNSIADQKAVITHVIAHSDFFKNNNWFVDNPNAAAMLEQNAKRVEDIIDSTDVSREEVEQWIDNILCIEDNIDQYAPFRGDKSEGLDDNEETVDVRDRVEEMDLDDSVKREIFDEEWLEEQVEEDTSMESETDLMKFFLKHGKRYEKENDRAVEYEEWQYDVLEIIRDEAYYFAPQKMTKTMNEGWAAYWESTMMTDEGFAGDDEWLEYADHMARVLGSPGFNPYALGMELWEYVENKANRREVVEHILRVDGIRPENFREKVDFSRLNTLLDKPQSDDIVKRNYSLTKPQNRGFIKQITQDELESTYRYLFEIDRYDSVDEAVDDVNYNVGWNRMYEVRDGHNDITFIDEFLDAEFLRQSGYFTYEYNHNNEQFEVASVDPKDVKQKLLLQFTNFGKPTITVADGNYKNKGYLLLHHEYNGVMLDLDEALDVLERLFELWGRPVYLKTIVKNPREGGKEEGRLFEYNGDDHNVEELDLEEVEDIAAEDVDYSTKPDDWG